MVKLERERKPRVRRAAVALMKPGVVIINTSRGALVRACVRACELVVNILVK